MKKVKLSIKTGKSIPVKKCQSCGNRNLSPILFIGYLPPVNEYIKSGATPEEQVSYPAQLLFCSICKLVQLGLIVNPEILFPKNYPYTSSTTKVLRDNFKQLSKECERLIQLNKQDLIVDIGSNDGNLLDNFKTKHRVLGITPEDIGKLAIKKGIPTILNYFTKSVAEQVAQKYGKAKIITATNVFAHIENVNDVIKNIKKILHKDGVFISESHYLLPLLKKVQYDTIYHEHLRYYSLHSLKYLLEMHELEIFYAREIPPHGGSLRVYAARKGQYKVSEKVKNILDLEKGKVTEIGNFKEFRENVLSSKLKLYNLLYKIKKEKKVIYGIGAPARGCTLIKYVGIGDDLMPCVLEASGSQKIGKYVPGTLIPVYEESRLLKDQPDYVLLLSWHIANDIIPKLKKQGYKGKYIIPLPTPRIVK